MYKYILRRLLQMIPMLIAVAFIVFFIMNLIPGDPGRTLLGPNADQEQVDILNEKLGYNAPYFQRFFNYIKNIVLHFDFGLSYASQKPVIDELLAKIPNTLKLGISSVLLSSILGIVLGVVAAVKQNSFTDNAITVLSMISAVMPSYWLGMLLVLGFSLKLGWFPSSGAGSFSHFVLPVATLTLSGLGSTMRMTRSVMLESLRNDYVRTIRAKGVPERVVVYGHALRNAMLPLITKIGTQLASIMAGTVLTETVFNIPGVGRYMVVAIGNKDIPAVMTSTILFALVFSVVMLLMDIVYALVDPRMRAKYTR